MKLKRILFSLFVLLFTVQLAHSQRTITGTVTDDTGETVIGAAVLTKEDRSRGVATDFDGNYTIEVPAGTTALIFSYVGMREMEVPLGASDVIDVQLESDTNILDDVVISASKRKEKILDAPASVSVITAERIENNASLTPVDNLKKTPGVDVMTTGLVGSNVNIRGFNDIFSGAMLTMVDNRIGRVPSLRVNAFQLIPGNNYDIDKMEVVRGPGAALYGPNAADGVLHIITKSPIDQEKFNETTISLTTGLRGVTDGQVLGGWPEASGLEKGQLKGIITPEIRTSFKFSDKVGLKISGKYMQGEDWEYYDFTEQEGGVFSSREPAVGDAYVLGSKANGQVWAARDVNDVRTFDRDFTIQNYNGDARLDFRPTDDTEIVLSGGLSSSKNLELTGLGAAQSLGWQMWYAQARFRYKNLFAQFFTNSSNSGDETYLIPQFGALSPNANPPYHQFDLLTDKSKLHVAQLQHSTELLDDDLQLIYGADLLMTRPETEGTINGRFEDRDNFNQYGAYLQGDYKLDERFKFVAAVRADYHDLIEEFQISPRIGMTYKPTPKQTLRLTYNRAFSTPSSLATSLDLSNGLHPVWGENTLELPYNDGFAIANEFQVGSDIRGIGNYNGYQYNYNEAGEILYHNFWDDGYYTLTNNTVNNHVYFQGLIDLVGSQLQAELPEGSEGLNVEFIVEQLFAGITGENGDIQDARLVGIDLIGLASGGTAQENLWNGDGSVNGITDFEGVKSSITQTYELGWKGIISNRLFANVDFYVTRKSNYQSPLISVSPTVGFHPDDLDNLMNEYLRDNLETWNPIISGLIEGGQYVVEQNEDAFDEIVKIIQDSNAQIGVGLITPENEEGFVGDDLILTYKNLGDITLWGFDVGGNYLVKQNGDMQAGFAYSYLSTDRFEFEEVDGFLGVNTPKHKVSVSWDHKLADTGIGYGLNLRAQTGFPANSAVYIDEDFPGFYNVDTRITYQPKFSKGTAISLEVNNFTDLFYDHKYRTFPGTPEMGAIGFLKIKQSF